MTETPSAFALSAPPPAAVDATASRALTAAGAAAAEARDAAARAVDVDWVARAARAYEGRVDEALRAFGDAVTLLDAAAGSARRAEERARSGAASSCLGPAGGR